MRHEYRIYCVRPIGGTKLLLAGLGYERHIKARWRELTGKGPKSIPIGLSILLRSVAANPAYVKFECYGVYETRKEAEDILLNLRMGNNLLIVEDWRK